MAVMANDSKYGVVTTSEKEIPADEPIFILRGKDSVTPLCLEAYISALSAAGYEAAHPQFMAALRVQRDRINEWQKENRNRVRLPD
jgi:hypothetical protein